MVNDVQIRTSDQSTDRQTDRKTFPTEQPTYQTHRPSDRPAERQIAIHIKKPQTPRNNPKQPLQKRRTFSKAICDRIQVQQ